MLRSEGDVGSGGAPERGAERTVVELVMDYRPADGKIFAPLEDRQQMAISGSEVAFVAACYIRTGDVEIQRVEMSRVVEVWKLVVANYLRWQVAMAGILVTICVALVTGVM